MMPSPTQRWWISADAHASGVCFLCATLADQAARQRSFADSFEDPAVFRFVEAIDGRDWTEEDADRLVTPELKLVREQERLKGKTWLNPAAVACAVTHRDKLLSAARTRSLILCEDDIRLAPDFVALWSDPVRREALAQLDGVVLIHYASREPITALAAVAGRIGQYTVHRLHDCHVVSGACYYAPPAVAEEIAQFQTPIRCTADHWLEMKQRGAIKNMYAMSPSPVRIAPLTSTIGYRGQLHSNSALARFVRGLRRSVRRRRHIFYDELDFR